MMFQKTDNQIHCGCTYIVGTFTWRTFAFTRTRTKNVANKRKHGISFEVAQTVFSERAYYEAHMRQEAATKRKLEMQWKRAIR